MNHQDVREWWNARDARERVFMTAGVAALLLAACWAYLWTPLTAERARLIDSVPRLRAQAQLVAAHSAEAETLRAAARGRPVMRAPQAVVEQAMKTAGLGEALSVKPLAEGRVQVNFQSVSFEALVRVIGQLGESHGFAVESLTLKAATEPGKVQVETLVLRPPRSE
jgi:general secretion pathway protein M